MSAVSPAPVHGAKDRFDMNGCDLEAEERYGDSQWEEDVMGPIE